MWEKFLSMETCFFHRMDYFIKSIFAWFLRWNALTLIATNPSY